MPCRSSSFLWMCSGSTGRVGPVAKPGCPDGPRRTALAMTSREEDGATLRLLETTGKSQERPRRSVRRSLRRRQPKRCGDGRAEVLGPKCRQPTGSSSRRVFQMPNKHYTKRCVHTPGPGRDKAGSQPRVSRTRRGLRAVDYSQHVCETESPKVGAKLSKVQMSRESKSREPKVESQRKSESPKVEQSKSSLSPSPGVK